MAISNSERIGKGLDLLASGLKPFVERELKEVHGDRWKEMAQSNVRPTSTTRKKSDALHWDAQAVLSVMWDQWNNVFSRTLGQGERSLVSELREVRNKWAHQHNFSGNDAHRALDSIGRLLAGVSASEAAEVEQMRMDLLRVQFDEHAAARCGRSPSSPPRASLKAA